MSFEITPEYSTWRGMKARCERPSHHKYHRYGGRGIVVCRRWKRSFNNFLADMGCKPSPQHSIDRIDNDGNYEPSNCRWATQLEQQNNTQRTVLLTYQGKTQSAALWAREKNVSRKTLNTRLKRGWSIEQSLETNPADTFITHNGRTQKLTQWAREMGCNASLLRYRVRNWPLERAMTERPRKKSWLQKTK